MSEPLATMFSAERIAARVRELGAAITGDYAGRNLVVVCVLKGSFVFTADLMRKDLLLALSLAHELGVPMPATEAAAETLAVATTLGLGGSDIAAVARVLRDRTGSGNDSANLRGQDR